MRLFAIITLAVLTSVFFAAAASSVDSDASAEGRPDAAAETQKIRPPPEITPVRDLLGLTREAVSTTSMRVCVEGVVTLQEPARHWFYVQDATGGALVVPGSYGMIVQPGQKVRVTGAVGYGIFAPYVEMAEKVEPLGEAPLPEPKSLPLEPQNRNKLFGQFVEIEGYVRDVLPGISYVTFLLVNGTSTFGVRVNGAPPGAVRPDWFEARIRVRGVNWPEGQNILQAHSMEFLETLSEGTTRPFDRPFMKAADLIDGQRPDNDRRVKISAHFVGSERDAGWMYESDGVVVRVAVLPVLPRSGGQPGIMPNMAPVQWADGRTRAVAVGDEVAVLGEPLLENGSLVMQNAQVLVVKSGAVSVMPRPTTASALAATPDIHRLVRLTAEMVSMKSSPLPVLQAVRHDMELRDGPVTFPAHIYVSAGKEQPSIERGYLVELTGFVVEGRPGARQPFAIAMPSDAELRVLRLSAHAQLVRMLPWIGAGALVLLGAVGWIVALQRKVMFQKREVVMREALRRELEQRVEERTNELDRTRQDLERALSAEKELGQLKSRFVSIVSHEFRTPLAVIGSSAEIVERYHDRLSSGQRGEHIESIVKNVRRMACMMEDALVLSRLDSSALACRPRHLDPVALCTRLVDEMTSASERRNPVRVEAGAGLEKPACLDETLLRHMLANLLGNASKYSPQGSPVTLRVWREGDEAHFEVEDQGIGIPEADQARIFEAFHRAENVGKIKGTGLGLVITKRCCDLHGGRITFVSRLGEGTCFHIVIPCHEKPAQAFVSTVVNTSSGHTS
ncbi:MAG: hypothetical protein K1X78_06635 [Verrucomicrobiaceae bacterium]|nr:hypothetical protein [Verrucomicrobiaceae bacterium]